jgi:hypothetical protein
LQNRCCFCGVCDVARRWDFYFLVSFFSCVYVLLVDCYVVAKAGA